MGIHVFDCDCGQFGFLDIDNRSYMAHVLPDQAYDEFSGIVDNAIEKSGPSEHDKGTACLAWRHFRMLKAWQCPECGSLYIETLDRERHRFAPVSPSNSNTLLAMKSSRGVQSGSDG